MERRIYVSATTDQSLDERRRQVKAAIVRKICEAGYQPQQFWEMGRAANLAWNFDNVDRIMRECIGCIVIGFPRWVMSDQGQAIRLAGEYHHYEGAVAVTLGLPMMILAEDGVEDRGILWRGGGRAITRLPSDATQEWLDGSEFGAKFAAWLQVLASRKDIFLGYCSKSAGTAAQVQLLLQQHGATVHNWAMDFRTGSSILDELEAARATCTCGVFIFSEDDPLEDASGGAAPRDNVVFEAGYFISSKGASRCLIIRENEAKMPADLGGSIYISLDRKAGVSAIEGKLIRFLESAF
jgi:hypothetical protein